MVRFKNINAKNVVVIEDFVQIGSHCSLYSVSTIDNKERQIPLKKNCKNWNIGEKYCSKIVKNILSRFIIFKFLLNFMVCDKVFTSY